MKVWLDGQLVDKDDAKISVFDHCVLYGDGVFEGIRLYGGKIFKCNAHVDRLFESAEKIRLRIPYDREEIIQAMYDTVAANGQSDGYIRLVVTRGPGTLGLNPTLCPTPKVFCIVADIALYPEEMYRDGLALIIARRRRISSECLDLSVKSCNYLNNILAKLEAIDAGVIEAIMLNDKGHVSECTGDNIFTVSNGVVETPPLDENILEGITRQTVMDLAAQQGIEVVEKVMLPEDVFEADECFLTGTAAEVIAVTKVDDRIIGDGKPGPVTTKLLSAFREYIEAGDFE